MTKRGATVVTLPGFLRIACRPWGPSDGCSRGRGGLGASLKQQISGRSEDSLAIPRQGSVALFR